MAMLLLCALGGWQLRRNAWRHEQVAARNARVDLPPLSIAEALADPAAAVDRRALARGVFLRDESIAVHHVGSASQEGVKILTPLALTPAAATPADAPLLLVDRGLVPGPRLEAFLRADALLPAEAVEVIGLLSPLALQPVAPGSAASRPRIWPRFDPRRPDAVAALQGQMPRPLQALFLEAEPGPADELPVAGLTRPRSPVDHIAYALFWFAMAAAAAAHWVGFGFSRARDASRQAERARLGAPPAGQGGAGGTG